MSTVSRQSTALLSLDMQFESLAPYFDVTLKHGLMEVLENADELDAVALDAYLTQHGSGLRLLAAKPGNSFEHRNDRSAELATSARQDDGAVRMRRSSTCRGAWTRYTRPVLDRATRVVLVVQQTLSHLRDAKRMLQIFGHHGLSNSQVLVVVNRFEKNASISMEDMQRAMQGVQLVTVPSDFKTVAESINLGVPMYEHARGSARHEGACEPRHHLGGRPVEVERRPIRQSVLESS